MWQSLSDVWDIPALRIGFGIAITLVLVGAGYKLLARLRGIKDEGQATDTELLLNFREMASQGGLSYQEYRNIESLLVKPRDEEPRRRTNSRSPDRTEGTP